MPVQPLASVIIVTFNRVTLLKGCLATLRRQTYPKFEIIVVNGASVDGTKDYLMTQTSIKIINLSVDPGLSAARNEGIQAAKGEILVFVDDDCVMEERWLAKLLAPYKDPGVAGVGGKVIGLPDHKVFFDHCGVNRFGVVRAIHAGEGFYPYLVGCNMSFRRSTLDAVGFFDEAFFLCYDETDLCIRIQHAGHRLVFNAEAPIHHHIHIEGKQDPGRFYWKARSRRLFMLKNFNDEIGGWPGFLVFEVSNLGQNLCRFVLGWGGRRHHVSLAELFSTLRGALTGYWSWFRFLRGTSGGVRAR